MIPVISARLARRLLPALALTLAAGGLGAWWWVDERRDARALATATGEAAALRAELALAHQEALALRLGNQSLEAALDRQSAEVDALANAARTAAAEADAAALRALARPAGPPPKSYEELRRWWSTP